MTIATAEACLISSFALLVDLEEEGIGQDAERLERRARGTRAADG